MPRNTATYTVFISSPGDLGSDREAIERAIDSVNRSVRDTLSVRFETWDWKKDAVPGVSTTCQDVIDRQLPDFDIYLGLMWLRFGTPTNGVGSGTEHEFRSSLESHRAKGKPAHIFFFFKNSVSSLAEIDAEQLAKVQSFRKELGPLGALHGTYDNTSDLERILTINLTKIASSHQGRSSTEISLDVISSSPQEDQADVDLGYLDYLERSDESLSRTGSLLYNVTDLLNSMSAAMLDRTEKINQMRKQTGDVPIAFMRLMTNQVADEMERFSSMATPVLDELEARFEDGMDCLIKAIGIEDSMGVKYDAERIDAASGSMVALLNSLASSDLQLASFENAISSMPKLSLRFNKARKNVLTFVLRYKQMTLRLRSLAQNLLGAVASKASQISAG